MRPNSRISSQRNSSRMHRILAGNGSQPEIQAQDRPPETEQEHHQGPLSETPEHEIRGTPHHFLFAVFP